MTKVKKGDVVAIQTKHSSNDINTMKRKEWTTFSLARAARCNRKGIVERIWKDPRGGPEYLIDTSMRVYSISAADTQAAARTLFEAGGENTYESMAAIKEAILNAVEK